MDGMSELGTHGWESGKDSQYQVDLTPQKKRSQCEVHCFVARFLHMHKASSGLCSLCCPGRSAPKCLRHMIDFEVDKMTRKSCREMKMALERALNRGWRYLLLIGRKVGSIKKKQKHKQKLCTLTSGAKSSRLGREVFSRQGSRGMGIFIKGPASAKSLQG